MKTWSTLTETSDSHTVKHMKYPPILSLAGTATSIIFAATKVLLRQTCVCCNKTHILLQQKYACRDNFCRKKNVCFCGNKTFVTTNICRDKHNFVMTKCLSWQAYFCHYKHMFVMTKHVFCHNKSTLVKTKLLSWQTHVCRNKCLLWQMFCHTKYSFCRNKRHALMWQTHVYCDKHVFVATKIVLVAAPANDTIEATGIYMGTKCIKMAGTWLPLIKLMLLRRSEKETLKPNHLLPLGMMTLKFPWPPPPPPPCPRPLPGPPGPGGPNPPPIPPLGPGSPPPGPPSPP